MIWKSIESCTLLFMNTKGICSQWFKSKTRKLEYRNKKKIHNRYIILLCSKKEVDICSPNLYSMHLISIAHTPVHINKLQKAVKPINLAVCKT